jgi:sec-independent protein translocase protein TatC
MAEGKQTVLAHISELRRRLIAVLLVNLAAAALCFHWVQPIMKLLLELGKNYSLVYIAPGELFGVYVQVALICGISLAMPFTLFQLWMFVAEGLYRKEKLAVALSLLFAGVFFAGGVYFAFRLVLPTMLDFFLRIAMGGISSMISVSQFLSFVLTTLLCFGVVFEMPVAAALLSAFGLLRPGTIRKHQPAIIVLIFVLAAVLTPPDVVSQLMLALPMVVLLQLSIGVCWLVCKLRGGKKE